MREILDFFKDIFMIREDKTHIGLSQFRVGQGDAGGPGGQRGLQQTPVVIKKKKDLKLSDLMRGTVN